MAVVKSGSNFFDVIKSEQKAKVCTYRLQMSNVIMDFCIIFTTYIYCVPYNPTYLDSSRWNYGNLPFRWTLVVMIFKNHSV